MQYEHHEAYKEAILAGRNIPAVAHSLFSIKAISDHAKVALIVSTMSLLSVLAAY